MAGPTTLVEFWTAEAARLNAALAVARAALDTASAAEAAAVAAFTASGNALRDAKDEVDAARKKLAAIPMPADGDPLLADMRNALVKWRDAAAAHVATDADLRAKRAQRSALTARAGLLAARLSDAAQQLQAEQDAAKQRADWMTAAGASPLKDLPTAAGDALTAFAAQASAKVEGDFPSNAQADKSFLARARARRALGAQPLNAAVDVDAGAAAVNTTWDEKTTRESAKTAALQRAFQAAVDALHDYVQAPQRLEQARAALQSLAARPSSPLSAAQRAELITADATLKSSREAALIKLKARDDAQAALLTAKTAYDKALFAAQAADPDKTEADLLAADAGLKSKHDDVAAKQADLTAAEGVVAASLPVLKTWFAAVPDLLWDQLDALDGAQAALNAIKAINPANLVNAVKSTEQAVAQNLEACSKERRLIDLLRAGLGQRDAALADERELAPRRRQAAARFIAEV
jgi:hypothetical protein